MLLFSSFLATINECIIQTCVIFRDYTTNSSIFKKIFHSHLLYRFIYSFDIKRIYCTIALSISWSNDRMVYNFWHTNTPNLKIPREWIRKILKKYNNPNWMSFKLNLLLMWFIQYQYKSWLEMWNKIIEK